MTALLERLNRRWAELSELGRARSLKPAEGVDFSSNDYLGFSRHPALIAAAREGLDRGLPVGSTGSRLLRGNHAEHEALEAEAAAFFSAESALFFGSGFDANLAFFSTIPTRHDVVIHDERIHASVKEGLRAGFARCVSVAHNDPQAFDDAAAKARASGAREVFIAVESVYSMDGDRAPLAELLEVARRRDAVLVVDEAHATGVFGPRGRGLTEELRDERLWTLHTCGKALGVSGALLAAPASVTRQLIQAARPFLFSTAPSPLTAALVRRALRLVDEEPQRRKELLRLSCKARRMIKTAIGDWTLPGDRTQILPIVVGNEKLACSVAEELQRQGLDVRPIRPPTVPEGAARLRVSLTCERTEGQLRRLAEAIEEARHG